MRELKVAMVPLLSIPSPLSSQPPLAQGKFPQETVTPGKGARRDEGQGRKGGRKSDYFCWAILSIWESMRHKGWTHFN